MKKELCALIAGMGISLAAAAQNVRVFPHVLPVLEGVAVRSSPRTVEVRCDRLGPQGALSVAFLAQYEGDHNPRGFAQPPAELVEMNRRALAARLADRSTDPARVQQMRDHLTGYHAVRPEEIEAALQVCAR